ncbi:hypothetical protein HWB26_gp22 [Lentibacter phage vB_LenP_ICBM2]|jgi:hypothetical protein|uniref:Uncharacterized protein n=1 Tax=Lentibacter phage vB_LenP_ICBM2 TaxID=2847823 RepID=A0A3G2YRY4_9CAUD|nr:hypothetical protein HWB26_gp22 [Lentibacter phage vB_LenP_ICBM2]AYP28083.1 hypothetical protein vBLenPICBM2__22 [Lentibacter phage vB_LenP_ICBM2]
MIVTEVLAGPYELKGRDDLLMLCLCFDESDDEYVIEMYVDNQDDVVTLVEAIISSEYGINLSSVDAQFIN